MREEALRHKRVLINCVLASCFLRAARLQNAKLVAAKLVHRGINKSVTRNDLLILN